MLPPAKIKSSTHILAEIPEQLYSFLHLLIFSSDISAPAGMTLTPRKIRPQHRLGLRIIIFMR